MGAESSKEPGSGRVSEFRRSSSSNSQKLQGLHSHGSRRSMMKEAVLASEPGPGRVSQTGNTTSSQPPAPPEEPFRRASSEGSNSRFSSDALRAPNMHGSRTSMMKEAALAGVTGPREMSRVTVRSQGN
mmetsp:Transcript_39553/g.61702  ORF Transcript_39553/g.61702 Transcript_39553/m.61702 type:complete len:129 (+) Transcript_39553:67-453(+)|eukprot:CAMPEP_0184300906 /NCGR_PEP_ID=MMETSP1049-20130417/11223_1 /TAXON_ID=77928 /ORGANISM="Proteomonas sulcata, Strain CCMP704" /LENGTH=128 /DNA_ID=CAMNT_0026611751 /DNA_START=51 /DNA_END=437 /DNA_ORIENTATION=+